MDCTLGPLVPRGQEALANLHLEIAHALELGLHRCGDALAWHFGEKVTNQAMRGLLIGLSSPVDRRPELLAEFDRAGWRKFLEAESGCAIDFVELTQVWRDAAGYAGQGIAPGEPSDGRASMSERKTRVRSLVEHGNLADTGGLLLGIEYDFIWVGVAARGAIDFGGTLSIEGGTTFVRCVAGCCPKCCQYG
jgi:hypothetical protein